MKIKTPGRKCLDDIMKVGLLEGLSSAGIMNMWTTHHQMVRDYWGRVVSDAAYEAMRPRLEKNPYFVVPVFRDKGLFNVVTNFSEDLVLVCPLGEWQQKQSHAQPHMTLQFFTELQKSKKLVLARCELQDNHMTKQDAMFVTHMLLKYYTLPTHYALVEQFNKEPHMFNFNNYLRQIKEDAAIETGKGKNVRIEDAKRELVLPKPTIDIKSA
eukprot:TRINITY_DN1698_c0_g1_i1.p1 TRINITY_DN1698_c0_g1~~TRINITY_DN1698_c0_g1_i1.p1  ORF type:complete len:234 (+),score=24.75 TRINITY_DN1698_c0_g1_i1:67-702(+)